MTATASTATAGPSRETLSADFARPLVPVSDITSGPDLTEIGRLAVHLAALERAVLPAAAARLRDGAARAAHLHALGRELATGLHWMDRHLTGDARAVRWPTDELAAAVRDAAAEHASAERELVRALAGELSGGELVELTRSYHHASLAAPTRPHPRLTWRTRRGRLVFRIAARIDGIRDVLDNRPVRSRVSARAACALRDLGAIPSADGHTRPLLAPAAAMARHAAVLP